MEKRFLLTLVLIIQMLFPFTISQTYYVALTTSYNVIPQTLEPGDNGNLILTITNIGMTYADNVRLKFSPSTVIELYETEYDLQTITAGGSKQIVVPFKVLETAPYGVVALRFKIEYTVDGGTSVRSVDDAISITITRRPSLEVVGVDFDEKKISPGEEFEKKIRLKNVGKGIAKDVILALDVEQLPFIPVYKSSELYIGDMERGEIKDVTLTFLVNDDAEIKPYLIPLTLNYYDELGNEITDEKSVGIALYGRPELVLSLIHI